jgi:PQQ-dependent catabolism-associated CXXCW motif protein
VTRAVWLRSPRVWAPAAVHRALFALLAFSLNVIGLAVLPSKAVAVEPAGAEGEVAEPSDYRIDNYRAPVPKTLKGARVISAEEAEPLWRNKTAIFIDVFPRAPKPENLPASTVWRDPTHMSMEGAHWLPNVGYGVLSPAFEEYFRTRLSTLAGGDPSRPVVFFCQKDCWMSWNAAKRALEWGYKSVIWFSEGTDAWQEAGYDLKRVDPVP